MKFNQANVRTIPLPDGKTDHIVFDEAKSGFGVRVRPSGNAVTRSYIVQYKIGGKHGRMTLGKVSKVSLEAARVMADKAFAAVTDGRDPQRERQQRRDDLSKTFDKLKDAYLASKEGVLRERSLRETKRHLNTHWKPLHDLPVASIDRATVAGQLNKIERASGAATANRARSTLSALFVWAMGEGEAKENPTSNTNKRDENGPRERVLEDAELASIYAACDKADDYPRIVRLLALTACRREEIGALRWSEIDFDKKTITIPKERTKNKARHIVPLSEAALAILKEIPRQDREHVFGYGYGGFSGWSQSKKRLDAKCGVKFWTLHDLRRTMRTGMAKLGILPHVAEAVLNHLPPKIVRTYAPTEQDIYAKEKREALDMWAHHLEMIRLPTKATPISVRAVPTNQHEAEVPRASFADRLAASTRQRNVH
jgi:integrase